MGHVKLHIPGPVEVSEKTFRAFCSPMIGHRGQGFKDLYAKMQPQLQQLLCTKQLVYMSTSSAWGVMEGALRNLVSKKVLNCMCGAFSDKWLEVSKRCGKDADALQVPWGSPIRAEAVDKKLATGQFDALTLIHNETSTGVMSPLGEIAALKKKYPDVMFIVDSVSSMTAVPLKFDELAIDVLLEIADELRREPALASPVVEIQRTAVGHEDTDHAPLDHPVEVAGPRLFRKAQLTNLRGRRRSFGRGRCRRALRGNWGGRSEPDERRTTHRNGSFHVASGRQRV